MRTITTLDRQTLFDIALQAYGRAEAAYDIALANDLVLSDTPAPGTILMLPNVERTDKAVVDYYALNGITPATAASQEEVDNLNPEGIAYWYIKEPVPVFVVN